MTHFKIVSRWDPSKIIYEGEAETLGALVGLAVANGANLSGANLSGADLRSADLSGADLSGANLSGADLRSADLIAFKADLWMKLTYAKPEAAGLRLALIEGRINGSAYEGECACFVGTIANVRSKSCGSPVDYAQLTGIHPDSGSPVETFFMAISEGDTPETNQISRFAVEFLEEFMALNGIPFEA